MWHHFILAFCCFTVAVTASERSPAKVRIHHERSTHAELIASVEALGKTHQLKLKRPSMPSARLLELIIDASGTVSIQEVVKNQTRNYFEDEDTGAFLFMNDENTLEGMVSDSVALHYENNKHTASAVNKKIATPFCDVSGNSLFPEELHKDSGNGRQQVQNKLLSYVVEVLVAIDSTLYNFKSNYYYEYLKVYWKMVDRRFRTVSGANISLSPTVILSCSSTACDARLMDAQDPNYAQLHLSKNTFATFLAGYTSLLPTFDVAHLITKRDLFEWSNGKRYTNLAGAVPAIGAPCYATSTFANNSGISEDDGFWGGTIATAHEIGHNLGAYHDGEGTSTSCSFDQGYLMSYVRNSYRSFWFSPCSSAAMVNVYSRSYAGCLNTTSSPTHTPLANYIAGTIRSLDTQCKWATKDSTAIPDPTVSPNDQCIRLTCRYVNGTTLWKYTSGSPALEGTPCSTGGYCKDGYCQASWQ